MHSEKEIELKKENFNNVRFIENYCLAVYKGNADKLNDIIDIYIFLDTVVFKGEKLKNESILDIKTHFKPTDIF